MKGEKPSLFTIVSTGTRIRTLIKGFGDLYSTIELCPYLKNFGLDRHFGGIETSAASSRLCPYKFKSYSARGETAFGNIYKYR